MAATGKGRKPIDVLAQEQYGNQDSIWRVIRLFKGQPFTFLKLICRMVGEGINEVSDTTVRSYLQRLERGGFLIADVQPPSKGSVGETRIYRLVKDQGNEAPRLDKQGKPTMQGKGNEQMWRAMKVLGRFDAHELAIAASTDDVEVKLNTAKAYCRQLHKASYLIVKVPSKPGTGAVYQLLPSKNTGPHPPQIQRSKHIFDPNLNQVVWREEYDFSD